LSIARFRYGRSGAGPHHAQATGESNAEAGGFAPQHHPPLPELGADRKNNVKTAISTFFVANSMLKSCPLPRLRASSSSARRDLCIEEMENGKPKFLLLHNPDGWGFRLGCNATQQHVGGGH
jgi:hypothetical protein